MATGDLIKLGTFYKAGVKQAVPTRPWRSGTAPEGTPGPGNIPVFSAGQTLEIRDTDPDDAYILRWREVNVGNKRLLICDRNILEQVSWDDLNAQGLIFGKEITIDGQKYKLRVLTGGVDRREGGTGSSYGGGKLPNEWDDIIVNEGNYPGLPTPTASDLDNTTNATDYNGAHNQFWNWYYMYSWCQETYLHDSAYRAVRGNNSARYWGNGSSTGRRTYIGWRPVLEVLNSAPVISGEDEDFGEITAPFTVNYSVDDSDPDDAITVTEKVGDIVIRTINNAVRGQTYILDISSVWPSLSLGAHTATITADDGKGGIAVRTYTFTKKDDRIKFSLRTPIETSIAAKRIVVSGIMDVPQGAFMTVRACNNGFDTSPTWEDITQAFMNREAYTFANNVKTAEKWGVNIEFEILKGTATELVTVDGFGFAFD